jgi:hypothetical protein
MATKLIKKNAAIASTALFIFLMWTGIALQINHEESLAVETEKNHLHNVAASLREHVQASFRATDDALRLIKFHYESNGLKSLPEVNKYFRAKVIDISKLNQIGVIDEQGIYAFSNLDNHKKMDLSDREHFKIHQEGYPYPLFISKPVLGRASGKWSFQITRKLEKPDGSFNGVVVASFNPVQFLEQFQRAGLNSSSLVGLVGMDGYARALRVGNSNRADDTLKDLQLPIAVSQSDSGSFTSKQFFDSTDRVYVFEKIENYPLFVIVGTSSNAAFQDFYNQRKVLIGFGWFFTLFAAALTWQWLRSIENCRQLQIETANQRQVHSQMQSTYEDCLNQTKNLTHLATVGTTALKHSSTIKQQIEQLSKCSSTFEENIDILEVLFQESLRVELGQISSDEFRFFVKKLSTKMDLEKLRDQMSHSSQNLREIFILLDELENAAR